MNIQTDYNIEQENAEIRAAEAVLGRHMTVTESLNLRRRIRARMKDSLGVAILPTDRVIVNAWGYGARLIDTGTRSHIVGFNRSRVVIIDCFGDERAVGPRCLAVLRRDGQPGLEGNREMAA